MKRKLLVIIFFVVVFGLPVCWYLFLQVFGENKFALPELGVWDHNCIELTQPSLVIQERSFATFPNQLQRIRNKLEGVNRIRLVEVDSCMLQYDVYLVDAQGMIRGEFSVSREETDRLLAEIDILLVNEYDKTNQSK